MKAKKAVQTVLLLLLCLALSGCRVRTTSGGEPAADASSLSGSLPGTAAEPEEHPDKQEKNGEPGGRTRENPDASRKEYDEDRPAEIIPGAERAVYGSGEGGGFSAAGADAERKAAKLNAEAEKTAFRTVAAGKADRMGVSADAEAADSAAVYYSALLRDRMGSLYECQRLTVYWETPEDHVTVFRKSPEHSLILDAGAYDVSARLQEGSLRVDDGWIGRKNPGVVVKAVDRSVLGTGVFSAGKARTVYAGLLARDGWSALDAVRSGRVLLLSEELLEAQPLRLAAMLMIAKTAAPDLLADVDIGSALAMLGEEASGSVPRGTYYYNGQGGF